MSQQEKAICIQFHLWMHEEMRVRDRRKQGRVCLNEIMVMDGKATGSRPGGQPRAAVPTLCLPVALIEFGLSRILLRQVFVKGSREWLRHWLKRVRGDIDQ